MWKYQQPDFALFLLGELQKQQQGSVFCDTLLQTEDVCVPAHSCVLAALSPIFCRVLSSSPAEGKNRLLSLEAVGSRALLKLVGFLYTGEMEIKNQSEHEEVMAAAHRLGLRNLIEKKRVWVERGADDVGRCWKEAGVQTEADWSCAEASPVRGFNWISDVTLPFFTDMTEASVSNQHKTKDKKRWKMRDVQLKPNHLKLNFEGTKTGVTERSRNVSGKDFRKLLEAVSSQRNATAEHKETKLDQFKVKIKLRRKGTCWESNLLVSVQGESESEEQCGPPPLGRLSGVRSGGTLTPPTDLLISPSDSSTHLYAPAPTDSSVSSLLHLPILSSSPAQADESDEHIAMLLEDMVMMGLNILPLMPLDRNLDEPQLNQLDPLQEQGGQSGAEVPAQGSSLFVQGCEPEIGESGFSETSASRNEELELSGFQNQLRPEIVEPSALHASHSNLSKDKNLETVARTHSAAEDLWLTPKAVPDCPLPETGDMTDYFLTFISDDRLDFKLLRCLSPLDPENADSDVPTQESPEPSQDNVSETHKQQPETQNLPAWLSASSLELDFSLSSMISSSHPRLVFNGSFPDLEEKQVLKTSVSHHDAVTGSHSDMDQADVSGQHPKKRITRSHLAAQKLKVDRKCQNLVNESQPNTQMSTSVDANRKTVAGVKRRKEDSLSFSKKIYASTTSRRHEHEDGLPEEQVPVGTAKRGRGRPPKSKTGPAVFLHRCKKLNNPPASSSTPNYVGQGDCEVKEPGEPNESGGPNEPGEPNKPGEPKGPGEQKGPGEPKGPGGPKEPGEPKEQGEQEKDSRKMGDADVNGNFEQIKQNVPLSYTGQAKAPSIINHIFHQTCPSTACKTSLLIGQQVTNLQGTSFPSQRFRGVFGKSGDCRKLVNNTEQSSKGENEKERTVLVNDEEVEALDNRVRLEMSHGNMPDAAEEDRPTNEENLGAASAVIQCDFLVEMGKNIPEQPSTTSDIMMSADVDVMETIRIDSLVIPNKPATMERIDMTGVVQKMPISFCITPDGTPAGNLENKIEAASDRVLQKVHVVNNQVTNLVAGCLENNVEENLGRCKVVQSMKETFEGEDTELQRTNDGAVQKMTHLESDVGCQEMTRGCDSDIDIDVEGDQCSSEMVDKQILLDEEERSIVHTGSAKTVDVLLNAAQTPRDTQLMNRNAVQTDEISHQSNSPSEDGTEHSGSKDDSDEEAIEVDVLEGSAEAPLWPLAAGQIIPLPTESLQDQEVEMDVTEEEEVDVTGEETD